MSHPAFIRHLRVRNLSCLRDVSLQLSPLHALVGPSDAGKTLLLRAVTSALAHASPAPTVASEHRLPWPEQRLRWPDRLVTSVEMTAGDPDAHLVEAPCGAAETTLRVETRPGGDGFALTRSASLDAVSGRILARPALWSACDPDREIVRAVEDERERERLERHRMPLDVELRIIEIVRQACPDLVGLRVLPDEPDAPPSPPSVEFRTHGETWRSSALFGRGLRAMVGLAALRYRCMDGHSVVIIDGLGDGMHPSWCAQAVHHLRRLSERVQVIVTTTSPVVLNQFAGDEVTVVTRTPVDGTRASLLSSAPRYDQMSKEFGNGELWALLADGVREAPLLDGKPAPV